MTSSNNIHLAYDGYRVEVADASSLEASRWERELEAAGFRLPFPHRTAAAELEPSPGPLFFLIRDASSGAPRGGFAAQRRPSRALPGHYLLRVERFGQALPAEARAVGVRALADLCRATPRVLRAYLGVYSIDPSVRQEITSQAAAAGFRKSLSPRGYDATILIDLRPDEEELFASFHATARRHVRAAAKHPVEVRLVNSPEFAGRLDLLVREVFARTGGSVEQQEWPEIINFSARHPERSRLVGLFRTDATGPESLLAFAHCYHHGDHAEYSTAASSRSTDVKVPQTYVLAWDLIRWAKRHGAVHFDFGGVTPLADDDSGSDPLQGISAFKRFFSKTEAVVADEWMLEPSRLKADLARVFTSVAKSIAKS
ncbi:MAG: GNAT family N-acetyltransferase [Pyrinomonadaceae bacterium]